MVYCGKPSKACGECRLRRTKCDTKKPACSQCLRAGRTCQGYRDPADLMFRDEAEGLSTKRQRVKQAEALKKDIIALAPKSTVFDDFPNIDFNIPDDYDAVMQMSEIAIVPVMSFNLGTSPQEQATCFFFQNYVSHQEGYSRGTFQYLYDIYGCEEIGTALADSIVSLGMVGLAHFWNASSIMTEASKKYNSALQTLSSHLRNANEAKADQTIIAIMLLGLYETNTCSSRQSMETWTRHINGALALLQFRGEEQLRTPIGYQLFIHLRIQVITNCIQRHASVPEIMTEWSQRLDFEKPEEAAATTLSLLAIRYCNLRSSMSCFHDYSDPERIITTACALDAEYDAWTRSCPLDYIYQSVTVKDKTDEVFSDHYHVYSSVWIAAVLNNYRSARILVNELILDQLGYLYTNVPESNLLWNDNCFYENQLLTSNTTLLQLCHDICASVPYFLGYNPDQASIYANQKPRCVNGNLLLWPLYTAGVTGMVSDMMRSWVAGRLQYITDVMGIRQAAPLAYSVVRRQDHSLWNPEPKAAIAAPADCEIICES